MSLIRLPDNVRLRITLGSISYSTSANDVRMGIGNSYYMGTVARKALEILEYNLSNDSSLKELSCNVNGCFVSIDIL